MMFITTAVAFFLAFQTGNAGAGDMTKVWENVNREYSSGVRDPFVPASIGRGKPKVSSSAADEPFTLEGLVLTSIIFYGTGAQAVLANVNTGAYYVLRDGRVYDKKQRPVAGVSGVIKAEDRQAAITAPDGKSVIIKLPERRKNRAEE